MEEDPVAEVNPPASAEIGPGPDLHDAGFGVTAEGWLDQLADPETDEIDGVPLKDLDPDKLIPAQSLARIRRELLAAPLDPLDLATKDAMLARIFDAG